MNWTIFISSLILSFVTLLPLGMKWEIESKVIVPSAICIGVLSGLMTNTISGIWNIEFYQILVLEFFLIVGISLSLLMWRFYRDPERIPPEDPNTILSPADGRIIYVKRIEKGVIPLLEKKGRKFSLGDFTKCDVLLTEGYLIGISMNFLDVHVNRAPIGGKISLIRHIKGGFISLKKKEAIIQNERAFTVIDNGIFKVGIVQIASRLVRRIVSYFHEGYEIKIGERLGMIRFGSQVDLILPQLPSLRIEINPGEEVRAGVSIVARFVRE